MERRSSPGCDGRSETRTQGAFVAGGYGRNRGRSLRGEQRGPAAQAAFHPPLPGEVSRSGRGDRVEISFELRGGTAAPPRARSDRRGVRPYPKPARARPERLRARRLLAPLVRALRLQALGQAAEAAPHGRPRGAAGAGGERRRDRHRRGPGLRVQGGEPQPSHRGRALPGRGHRRRRHPPRHRRHGRAPGRPPRRPALRRPGLLLRSGRRGDRALRQLCRRPDRGR